MPKLKSALIAHQANATRYAEEQKRKDRAAQIKKQAALNRNGAKGKKRRSAAAAAAAAATAAGVAAGPGDDSTIETASSTPRDQVSQAMTDRKGKGRATIPFDRRDTILLLGEANFSFAHALLLPPHSLSGHMICATSYDPEDVCFKKYKDAKGHVEALRDAGARVRFGVDAGDLPKDITGGRSKGKGKEGGEGESGRWSRVVFNFPHAGAGITDQDRNILTNQHLLLRTLRAVHPILTSGPPVQTTSKKRKRAEDGGDDDDDDEEDSVNEHSVSDAEDDTLAPSSFTPPNRQGSLLITLLDQPPYSLWNLPKLATRPPPLCPGTRLPQPVFTLVRSFEFKPEEYTGYAHRRTIGFKDGVSRDGNAEIVGRKGRARTWEFVRAEK